MLHETFGLILHQPSIDASYSICDTCIEKLRNALQFKKQVQECEMKFADYCNNEMALQTEIKIESELMEQDINDASTSPDTLEEKESLKENEKSKKHRGRPKKLKRGRPKTSEKSRAEQMRDANRRYKQAHPEVVRNAQKRYAEKHPEVNRAAVKRYRDKKLKEHEAAVKPKYNDDTHDYEHSNAEYADNIELSNNDSDKEKKENIEYEQNCLEKQKSNVSKAKTKQQNRLEDEKFNIPVEQDINNASISPDILQENESLKENENSSKQKQRGRPKKRKPGRPKTSEKSRAEQRRDANRRYKQAHPEVVRKAQKRYAEKHPEVHRAAVKRYAEKHPEVNRAAAKRYRDEKLKEHEAAVKPKCINDDTHDYEHSNAEYADNIELSNNDSDKEKKENIEYEQNCLEKQKSNVSKAKTKQQNRLEDEKFNIPECNDDTHDYEHSNAEHADNIKLSNNDNDKEKQEIIEYEQNCLEKQNSATPCTEIVTECLQKEKTVETHSKIQPKKCLEKKKSNVSNAKHNQKNRLEVEKFNMPGNPKSEPRIKDNSDTGAVNTCHNCNSTFKSAITLRNHLQREHSIFSCKICKEMFGSKEALIKHEPIHSTIKHECDICGKVFTTKSNLALHKNQHTREKIFTCDICNKDFLYKTSLRKHIDFHLGRNKKIMCELCGHTFNDMANLKSHIRAVHEKLRPFKCDQCPKTYSTRKILKIHTRSHTGERPYVCQHCDKAFVHSTALRYHNERLHTDPEFRCNTRSIGVKSYICYYCGREFSGRFALKRHIERHMGTAKIFPCAICHKNFATKAVMIRHMKSIHDPNKQFVVKTKCNLCNMTVTDMVKHMKTHTERLFQCEQCPKSYSESRALNRHVREIHCGITHDCNLCDKKYIKAKSLRIHKLKKHNAHIQVKVEQDARTIGNDYI